MAFGNIDNDKTPCDTFQRYSDFWSGQVFSVTNQTRISLGLCRSLTIFDEFCKLSWHRNVEGRVIKNIDWDPLDWCQSINQVSVEQTGRRGEAGQNRVFPRIFFALVIVIFFFLRWIVLILIEIALSEKYWPKPTNQRKIKTRWRERNNFT